MCVVEDRLGTSWPSWFVWVIHKQDKRKWKRDLRNFLHKGELTCGTVSSEAIESKVLMELQEKKYRWIEKENSIFILSHLDIKQIFVSKLE